MSKCEDTYAIFRRKWRMLRQAAGLCSVGRGSYGGESGRADHPQQTAEKFWLNSPVRVTIIGFVDDNTLEVYAKSIEEVEWRQEVVQLFKLGY